MKIIAVFFTVICVLVLGILCQLSTYQSRYRPDCEYKQCMKPIRQHGNCPRWGSCQWYCQAKLANCTVGTRYHCARDLRKLEQFTSACAVEIFCLSGEEPYLSVQESTGKATVNCRPCYKKNVYNSRHNTSSATFSECHMLKKNLCKKQDNKIDCGNQNYTELTMTDGYCRCDARNGYAARSQKMCFYEYEVCFVKKCPEGMELLLNYTCGMLCPTGYTRQPESDICTEVSLTRPFSSDRPELNLTDVQTTSIRTLDAPSTNEQLYKQIIIPICLSVVVFVFVIVTILFRRQLKDYKHRILSLLWRQKSKVRQPEKGSKSQITNDTGGKATANRDKTYPANATASPAIPMDRDSGASFTATAVTEPSDSPGVGPMKDKGESKPTAIETPENKNTSEEIQLQTIRPNVEKPENLALNSTISNPEKLKIVTDHFGKGVPDTDTQTKITSGKTVPDSHRPREAQRSESQITNDTDGKGTTNRENTSPANATSSPAIPVDGDSGAQVTPTAVIETQDIPDKVESKPTATATPENKNTSAAIPVDGDSGAQLTATAVIETQDIPGAGPMKDKVESKPNATATPENKNTSVRAKPSHDISTAESDNEGLPLQKRCADVYMGYQSLPQEEFINIGAFMFDTLKDLTLIEPTSWATIHAIHVDGFVPYAISEKNITNLYELFSHLICGNDQLKCTLQCAAARFGIKYFGMYLKQLTEAFIQSTVQFIDAKIFFEMHGIYIEEFQLTEESVSRNLDKLLQEIFVTEITGPFHAELLSGVLDCNIIQHFENNRYYDRDVRTILGLNVYVESRHRELHIYWGKLAKNAHRYCLIPLFEKEYQTPTQNTNISQIKKIEIDSHNCIGAKIAEQKSFYWRTEFKIFIQSQNVVFDELRYIDILKPDCVMITIDVHGFKSYEKPNGEFCSVYELISHLLSGDNCFMFILRLAAARYAKTHFERYVTELANTFDNCFEANVFFKAHGITLNEHMKWPVHKMECVRDAFDRLVREAVNEGKGNAPFYIEFLSGVLNRKIHQHFEEKTYDGRKVDTIAGLNVSLTTDDSSDRKLHVYWMKSKDRVKKTSYWIFPLFECIPNCPGMELCEGIYACLKNENVFEENTCLDMINTPNIFEFDKLKEIGIIKPDTISMRTIETIQVEGFTAYEIPGEETSCIYEFMSYLLFENADMKYIMRLAAMRYALQNFRRYVDKLTGEFEKDKSVSSRVNGAKLFFEMHSIEFKKTKSLLMEKCVLTPFTDLVRQIANTGQGPFYVEFLRGALNCKIKQFIDLSLYKRRPSTIPGCTVTLTTSSSPERALHIYRVKTFRGGLSNHYKIVPLF
ncbi:uncharacterized protein LOC127841885 isoform X4 [Dreissena polymorpha]|uniref:uncharacterized protein LOC127841885 isoform X4 n=1 Tax=Dreissena polymorpha TaxID=45954 RepID=UPI0022654142|nr:uncharacterized protein LOC127841885 isoform X4 [Dreissena polymorpha]